MCGIAGMLAADGAVRQAEAPLNAMRSALRHRGPDDEGAWISPDGQAGFSHTRLAILDLSTAGHQPMQSRDGRLTITYNGEILNFRELRRALEQRGARFETRSDTEVILAAYELDGPGCIKTLRGMFAMAIWDARERTCVLARDRFGIKPLYFHADAGRLTFASEVKALVASGAVPVELDPKGALGYFLTGTVPEPHTLLRGVKCLEAGSFVVWKDGALSSQRYWDLHFSENATADRAVETTRAALVDSVTHHFVSDAPVGIFLSGGIDSTALVALTRDAGQRDVHTFSLSFPGDPADEGALARRTAAHFGTTHAEWAIDAATGRELFEGFLRAADQPSIDGLNTFAVSKFARQHGMKVVLSGLGGDELFGGYASFDLVPRLHAWNRGLAVLGPLRGTLGRAIEQTASSPRVRRVGDLLTQPADLSRTYQTVRGVFTHAESRALVGRYTGVSSCPSCDDAAPPEPRDPTVRDAISRLELSRYMRNQPLRDSDTMSMAWGLELRVPFLDGPLVDALSAIPAETRLQPGKRFLLQAVPEIPDWIAGQPKRGFMFPIQRWLDDDWREMFADVERDSPVPLDTWYRKWCVFVLARWVDRLKGSTIDE